MQITLGVLIASIAIHLNSDSCAHGMKPAACKSDRLWSWLFLNAGM